MLLLRPRSKVGLHPARHATRIHRLRARPRPRSARARRLAIGKMHVHAHELDEKDARDASRVRYPHKGSNVGLADEAALVQSSSRCVVTSTQHEALNGHTEKELVTFCQLHKLFDLGPPGPYN